MDVLKKTMSGRMMMMMMQAEILNSEDLKERDRQLPNCQSSSLDKNNTNKLKALIRERKKNLF